MRRQRGTDGHFAASNGGEEVLPSGKTLFGSTAVAFRFVRWRSKFGVRSGCGREAPWVRGGSAGDLSQFADKSAW